MLAHIDQDNIADYFPVQSFSWAVSQYCTGKHFFCATLAQADKYNIIGYFSAKTCLCALRQHWTSIFLVQFCLRHIWKTLTRQYSYASNVVPVWSIQHCKGYFLHKSYLLAMGQHYTGKNLVQCCPKGSRQQSTGKNPV